MVYCVKQALPIATSNGQYKLISDSNIIIYYNFDANLFNGNSSYYPSLGATSASSYGPKVYITGKVTFDDVDWDESYNFTNPSLTGFIS